MKIFLHKRTSIICFIFFPLFYINDGRWVVQYIYVSICTCCPLIHMHDTGYCKCFARCSAPFANSESWTPTTWRGTATEPKLRCISMTVMNPSGLINVKQHNVISNVIPVTTEEVMSSLMFFCLSFATANGSDGKHNNRFKCISLRKWLKEILFWLLFCSGATIMIRYFLFIHFCLLLIIYCVWTNIRDSCVCVLG